LNQKFFIHAEVINKRFRRRGLVFNVKLAANSV
jgi:hypothetical protein